MLAASRISRTTVVTGIRRAVHVEAKLKALGLEMPEPAVPKGNFVNYVVMGDNTVFLSGHLPQPAGNVFPQTTPDALGSATSFDTLTLSISTSYPRL